MPAEKEVFETEHVEIFRVDRGSLEEVLTISREMAAHAQAIAEGTAAWVENMDGLFTSVAEGGPEVEKKLGDIAEKTGEAESSMSVFGGVASQVLTGLGVALPALSIAGLVGLGVAIYGQTVATRQWAHEVESVSNLSQDWLTRHRGDMQDIAREYGYTHEKVDAFGMAIGVAGFTADTAMVGLRLSLERVRETGVSVEVVARNIAFELHELGYTEEEVATRTYQLAEWVGVLTEAWKLDAHEASSVATEIMDLGTRLQSLRGMPALEMRTILGLGREEFERLQMESPEQLAVKIMEYVDEASRVVGAEYRPEMIEYLLGVQFGVKDPLALRQMRDMILEGRIAPFEMPDYTKEELAGKRELADEEAEGRKNWLAMLKDIFGPGGIGFFLSGLRGGAAPPPLGEVYTPEGAVRPEYMATFERPYGERFVEETALGQAIRRLWQRMRGVEPEPAGTGGGPGLFPVPFGPGVPGAGPIEVNVNLIIEELPQGITVRTSDGMVLHTRGQGERFVSPGP